MTSDQASPIERIVETAVYAEDLGAAQAFYGGVLGLEAAGQSPGRHLFYRVGESMLLIFNARRTLQPGQPVPPHGTEGGGHFALGVSRDALPAWKERLEANGVDIERSMTWPRGGESIYFRDPAGNSVELITPGCWGTSSGW